MRQFKFRAWHKRNKKYMNTKGKNILEARKNAGLTMEELGKMAAGARTLCQ